MKQNQIYEYDQPENPRRIKQTPKKYSKYSIARGFLIDLLIAAILFGSFYVNEYGLPFTEKVYAVVSDTEASQLLITQSVDAGEAAAAASTVTDWTPTEIYTFRAA